MLNILNLNTWNGNTLKYTSGIYTVPSRFSSNPTVEINTGIIARYFFMMDYYGSVASNASFMYLYALFNPTYPNNPEGALYGYTDDSRFGSEFESSTKIITFDSTKVSFKASSFGSSVKSALVRIGSLNWFCFGK